MRYMEMALTKEWPGDSYVFMSSRAGSFHISIFYLFDGIRPTPPGYKELFLLISPTKVKTLHMSTEEEPKANASVHMSLDVSYTGRACALFMIRYSLYKFSIYTDYSSPYQVERLRRSIISNQYRNAVYVRRRVRTSLGAKGKQSKSKEEVYEGVVESCSIKLVPLL
jgi:hypothetical protein